MSRDAAESFKLLQEHYRAARELDREERILYVSDLRDAEPTIADRLAAMLDVSTEKTRFALPRVGECRSPEPGDSVGGFEILDVIASGGMGTVFRARQDRPRREVALKVMKAGLASPSSVARFRLEAEILGNLSHDGIATIVEAGVDRDGSLPYLAMEFVDGVALTTWAARENPDLATRLALVAEIADAVQHAHRRGVIHRDLKPANVLVTPEGRPKIIDFGIARARDADLHLTTLETDPGVVIGTLSYMSPEQLSGEPGLIDTRTDVYALGVMLHELLAGELPLPLAGLGLLAAAAVVRDTVPQPPSAHDRRCRGDLDVIVATALEKDKEARYGSASALADDIRRYLASEPIVARTPSGVYRLRKFVRRHRLAVASAAVVTVAVVGGAVVGALGMKRANESLQERLEQEKLHRRVVDFYYDSLSQIDASTGLPPHTFRDFLDHMSRRVDLEDFADDPLAEARIRSALGQAYLGSLSVPAALPHLERAIAIERERAGGRTEAYADLLRTRARCSMMTGDLAAAARGLEEAGDIYRALDCSEGRIRTEFRMSELESRRGRPIEAREHALAAVTLARAAGRPHMLAVSILEHCRLSAGVDGVETLLDEADAAAVSVFGDHDSLLRARILEGRAIDLEKRHDLDAALRSARLAREMVIRALGPDAPARFLETTLLGNLLARRGRPDDAERLLDEDLAIRRRLKLPADTIADTLAASARVRMLRGRHREAVELLREAAALLARLAPSGGEQRTKTLGLLMTALERAGDVAQAGAVAAGSLELLERAGDDGVLAGAFRALAGAARERGEASEFEEYKRRELEIRARATGEDSPEYADALIELAGHHEQGGRRDLALELFARAVPVLEEKSSARFPAFTAIRVLQYSAMLLADGDEEAAERELAAAAGLLVGAREGGSPYLRRAVAETFRLAGLLGDPDRLEAFYDAFE